jgi:endonuclease YncB( thermonuclease family)
MPAIASALGARLRARRRTVAVVAALAAAATTAGVVPVTSATAATASNVWGSSVTYGTVTGIDDGDSVVVRVDGDSTAIHVRNAGIQTMETGTCHAAQANAAMTSLASGKRVRLSLANPTASSMGRPVRYVDSWNGTAWVDTQLPVLKAGHALPMPGAGGDLSRWKAYEIAAQQASKARTNVWDTDFCGSGPSQSTPLRVWVNWDGNLDESIYPNQEWVRILNTSALSMSLQGWSMRTGGQDSYFFPSGTVVPAGGTTTLYVGKGTNTTTRLYWGSAKSKFPNTNATTTPGSGAYLYDPQGDVRAWSMYPCVYSCTDTLVGKVHMAVRADAAGVDASNVNGEYIYIVPNGAYTIDLSYKVLTAFGHTYEFPKGSYIRYGEVMKVYVGQGTTSRLAQHWGNTAPVLANAGGTVVLRTPEDIRLGCRAWGTGSC